MSRAQRTDWPAWADRDPFLPRPNPTFDNPAWDAASYRVLIARLSPWRDVDRSTPHLVLFQEVRRALPRAFVDFAFFPTAAERAAPQVGVPYLLGTQSLRPAGDFDLVLISNAYTLELINLPYLLLHDGIPLLASRRGLEWPIFLLGGSNALAAQAVVREDGDSLVDGLFFGEGEALVNRMVGLLAQRRGMDKRRALDEVAAQVTGLWPVGDLARPVRKAVLCRPDTQALLTDYPLLNGPEAATANLQISYGCPAFCSFCFEGYDRKPYRELALPDVLAAARQVKRQLGSEELNLYSFNFNSHPGIVELLLALHRLFERVGFKSQRLDLLQQAGWLLEAEVEADKRSFTLGVEGISQRQRDFLNKTLPAAEVAGLLERLLRRKIREVKLFYILTGHETEADLAEFRQFVRWLKDLRRAANPGIRVIFSFGLLTRMPFTPLRYDRLFITEGDEAAWRPLIGAAKSTCETNGFEFRLAVDWAEYAAGQVLALGGHWLADVVVDLARAGYCYDAALPGEYWERLRAGVAAAGHWDAAFLGEKGPDYPFALPCVRSDIGPDFLYRQYRRAREGSDTGYCLGRPDQPGACLGCGACTGAGQREAITRQRSQAVETAALVRQIAQVVDRKRHLDPVYYRLRLDPPLAGVQPEFLNAFVCRGLLLTYPELVDNLLSARESLFTLRANAGRFPAFYGETVFALRAWDAAALHVCLSRPPEGTASGFQLLGPAEGFVPGVFQRLQLDLWLPAADFPDARARLEQILRAAYLRYSLRRDGARYRFDLPAPALKKKILFDGWFEVEEDGFQANLEIGPKFDPATFLQAFGRDRANLRVPLAISGVSW